MSDKKGKYPGEESSSASADESASSVEAGGSDLLQSPGAAPEALDLSPAGPESPHTIAPAVRQELDKVRARLAAKEAQLAQVMEAYRNIKKETGKLRQRIEKSERRRFERSKNDFISHFVDVLDNLDRAIDSIENNFDPDSVLQGIMLVRSRAVQLLRGEGLEKIFVGGQPFNPTHSEAAAIEPVEDESKDNIVLKELQRGYMLKGSLLRPARVVVGRYTGERAAA
ncbi:MAG: nucleotide exchange factor GrpE, partial [Acidobacteriota bacterium]